MVNTMVMELAEFMHVGEWSFMYSCMRRNVSHNENFLPSYMQPKLSKLTHLFKVNHPIYFDGTLPTAIFCNRVVIFQSFPNGILLSIDINMSATCPEN